MRFDGKSFSIDVPEDAVDATAYTFVFPSLGAFPPNLTVREEMATDLDMSQRLNDTQSSKTENYPDAEILSCIPVKKRGDWLYFALVVEFGPPDQRCVQKETHILIPGGLPRLFTLSGTDLKENFSAFESTYDQVIRTFTPTGQV